MLGPAYQGFPTGLGLQDPVARILEIAGESLQRRDFVLHQEDGLAAPPHRSGGNGGESHFDIGRHRQEDGEDAAFPQPGIDLDPALMLLEDAVDRRQSQAGSLADFLGGKERLENPLHRMLVHAAAGIGHREPDEAPRPPFGILREIGGMELDPVGDDGEPASLRHGVPGIDRQVHHHLLHHAAVGPNGRQILARQEFGRDLLADQAMEHLQEILDHAVELDRPDVEDRAAAEHEELLGQGGGPFRVGGDFPQVGPDRLVEGGMILEHGEPDHHRAEDIVEIVGDAAGQLPDCFHFLRLTQPPFQPPLFGDVDSHQADDLDLAVRVENGKFRDGEADVPSVQFSFQLLDHGKALPHHLAIAFFDDVDPAGGIADLASPFPGRLAEQFLAGTSDDFLEGGAQQQGTALDIAQPDEDGGIIEKGLELAESPVPLLLDPQQLLLRFQELVLLVDDQALPRRRQNDHNRGSQVDHLVDRVLEMVIADDHRHAGRHHQDQGVKALQAKGPPLIDRAAGGSIAPFSRTGSAKQGGEGKPVTEERSVQSLAAQGPQIPLDPAVGESSHAEERPHGSEAEPDPPRHHRQQSDAEGGQVEDRVEHGDDILQYRGMLPFGQVEGQNQGQRHDRQAGHVEVGRPPLPLAQSLQQNRKEAGHQERRQAEIE